MPVPTDSDALREQVRKRYAALATADRGDRGCGAGGGCDAGGGRDADASACCHDATGTDVAGEPFGDSLYTPQERDQLPGSALLASLGCGNPTAIAELHEGETVLDLGSGGGIDVLLSARRVGPAGLVYGLDMTDEMLELARRNQAEAGVTNVRWLRGHIEGIPLPADSIDVIISNCVINLSADKLRVFREAARVLRPGGRLAVADVVADPDMDGATRDDMRAYTGCIAGALTRDQFAAQLDAAGFTAVTIEETHRVHAAAASAIIRAVKPTGDTAGGCDEDAVSGPRCAGSTTRVASAQDSGR